MPELIYKKEAFKIVGACMEVHNYMGNGFLEAVYQEALEIEFQKQGIPYKKEQTLQIQYKGIILKKNYIADFVCYEKIIVELKAITELNKSHFKQVFNYLKATSYNLGILVNFGQASLEYKRIVNEYYFQNKI